MKKSTLLLAAFAISLGAYAKGVTATWQLSDPDNLAQVSVTGGEDAKALVTPSFTKGDKIVTAGGIYGTIRDTKENAFIVEIADGVRIRVDKGSVYPSAADAAQNTENQNK